MIQKTIYASHIMNVMQIKQKKSPFDAFGHKTEGKYVWNDILNNAKKTFTT